MRLLLVLAMLWAAGCASVRQREEHPDCSNSPAHACQPGDTCRTSADGQLHVCLPEPPRAGEMSARALAMMDVGRAIALGSGPGEVERVAATLGPSTTTFQSCNRLGCDESPEGEATSMIVLWHTLDRDHPMLTVELCGGPGAWRVAHVSMTVTSVGGGAWGTGTRMRPVFAEKDDQLRRRCVR